MSNTLSLSFTNPILIPSGGYDITYWDLAIPSVVNTINLPGPSPLLITGLTGVKYAGTIQSICNTISKGNIINWNVELQGTVFAYLTEINNLNITGVSSNLTNPPENLPVSLPVTITKIGIRSETLSIGDAITVSINGTYQDGCPHVYLTLHDATSGMDIGDTTLNDVTLPFTGSIVLTSDAPIENNLRIDVHYEGC